MNEPKSFLPNAKLAIYIASYGILEIPEGVEKPIFSPPLALSGIVIQIINSNKNTSIKIAGRDFFTENYVATGQITKPVYGKLVGHTKSLMVFFNPLGMHQLFDNDLSLLTNRSIPLKDFLGSEKASGLIKSLKSNQENWAQIKVLDDFFLNQIPIRKDLTIIKKALDCIHKKSGAISAAEVLEECCCHRKTLERQFKMMVGLTPKVYIEIYQFKCLFNLLIADPTITWAQLAYKAGYFDQSHMTRYTREYLNVTPNNIVKLDVGFISYLLDR